MKEIYLDNSATTRVFPEVAQLVSRMMCEDYGNPSSMHLKGVEAERNVKNARETLAKILKVHEKEIYFFHVQWDARHIPQENLFA